MGGCEPIIRTRNTGYSLAVYMRCGNGEYYGTTFIWLYLQATSQKCIIILSSEDDADYETICFWEFLCSRNIAQLNSSRNWSNMCNRYRQNTTPQKL